MQSQSAVAKMEHRLGQALAILVWVGMFGFFGYMVYLFFGWLLFGAGAGLLVLAVFIGVLYILFGWLPDSLSKRTGQTRREIERSFSLVFLFVLGAVLGSYLIPKEWNPSMAWYWRVLLGLAGGGFALMTRRFR